MMAQKMHHHKTSFCPIARPCRYLLHELYITSLRPLRACTTGTALRALREKMHNPPKMCKKCARILRTILRSDLIINANMCNFRKQKKSACIAQFCMPGADTLAAQTGNYII